MIFSEKKYILGEKEIVLRSARTEETQMLIDYLNDELPSEWTYPLIQPRLIEESFY